MLPTKPNQLKSAIITAATVYCTGWGIYYLAQETVRRSHLRSRKKRYPLRAPLLPPHTVVSGARIASRVGVFSRNPSSTSHLGDGHLSQNGHADAKAKELETQAAKEQLRRDSLLETEVSTQAVSSQERRDWHGGASDVELAAIHRRFSSLKILGRYANVVPEWREQGAWEWVFWKCFYSLFYQPRIWWDGGLARDLRSAEGRAKVEALLPVEAVDWALLATEVPTSLGGYTVRDNADANPASPASLLRERNVPRVAASHANTFTWIGQSTCLVQIEGITILTDPVFGDQPVTSVFSPRRMRPMPCSFDDVLANVPVDVVLLTHNHFDHLDVSILHRFPSNVQFIVPVGLTSLLTKYGVRKECIHEIDWWDKGKLDIDVPILEKNGVLGSRTRRFDVTAVPASHWSARSPLDTNTTLWNSYAIRVTKLEDPQNRQASPRSLFFCGDTGYSPSLFTAIGRALGPFDMSCIPIGSYGPRWHMQIQHMHVVESVQVTRDIGSKRGFAMHWGTWQMSDERWDDPHRELHEELQKTGEDPQRLLTVPFGKVHTL
ncbi:Metallo-hydrolase/oxidoreductase [Testicularia cyperi]|uniref:Metallo-hydrolase/oxidoreductase n=1 Tax=Testicularia cyperi TaxID=1882483 RepID=A0A317XYV5_9BASI|nr:Metallo-hydrolase/oxidoreductase [Testicularia cyperi]